jgi:DNA-directed RNA polymerase subunit beta
MTADVEDNYIVAQANEPLDEERTFSQRAYHLPLPRRDHRGRARKVDYMDVSPKHAGLRRDGDDPVPSKTTTQTAP